MYKLIFFLAIVISFFECKNSNMNTIYINDKFDLIYKTGNSYRFYSKSCINASNLFILNSKYYISSKAFYCYIFDSIENNTTFYNIKLELKEKNDYLLIESKDSCFANYFNKSKIKFSIIDNPDFSFMWDSCEVIFYNESKERVKRLFFQRDKIDKILSDKLWIISNPDFKLKQYDLEYLYVSFIFYEKNKITLKRDFSKLPCWLGEFYK